MLFYEIPTRLGRTIRVYVNQLSDRKGVLANAEWISDSGNTMPYGGSVAKLLNQSGPYVSLERMRQLEWSGV